MKNKRGISPTISDDAVLKSTGKSWKQWFAILDAAGAQLCSHKEIVALLREEGGLNGWWQQMVTVSYEQARGMREKHEKTDGFQIGVSKTIAVPVAKVYGAWADGRTRKRWLPETITIRKKTENSSLRITWTDGSSSLDVMCYAKGEQKSQVTVNHGRLPDAEAAEMAKAEWRARLTRLKDMLEKK
ncbi:DUF4287 domain-containing protein [bacterium]|nr:DUF4287 domain-containing protein [bacterium]